MGQPKLYFVRHGQTDWNAAYRLQGQKDIPINARGREQAKRSGTILKRALADPAAPDYVASPLGRTRETMNILRRELDLPVHDYRTDERLKEISYGNWESFTFEELAATDVEMVKARHDDKFNFVAPMGESYAMLLLRVQSWLPYVERDTVAVCHGGIIRVLLHHLCGMEAQKAVRVTVPQDAVFFWDGEKGIWLEDA